MELINYLIAALNPKATMIVQPSRLVLHCKTKCIETQY